MAGEAMRTRAWFIVVMAAAGLGILPLTACGQEEFARALARLGPVFGEAEVYPRKGKEDIYQIARRYGVSSSALFNAKRGDLLAGDELLVIPAQHIAPLARAEGVVVNLTERNLYVYQNGRPVRCFPVAIGMRGWETPTGEFTIANRRKNPTWFPPEWALEEKPVPPGPGNPLGDRWMGLSARGYGIHATNAPASIGRYVSHGCMRMYPEHAHELYELVVVGTPVQIVYRRVAFGRRPGEGVVYIAYYPDPYQMGEVKVEHVVGMLKEYGLDAVADRRAVARALERPSGMPVAVVGSRVKLKVNGRPVGLALGPMRRGDDWLVAAGPLVEALGARMEVGTGGNYVVVTRGAQRVLFSPGDREAIANGELVRLEAAPQLAAGYPLIPLKATVTALGGSLGWDAWTDTVLVWDGWGIGRVRGL